MSDKESNKNKTENNNSELSRRKFLGTAAATSALTLASVNDAQAARKRRSGKIRIAGVGCGNHAAFLFSLFIKANNRDAEMVAL